jgi:hypothetical protein
VSKKNFTHDNRSWPPSALINFRNATLFKNPLHLSEAVIDCRRLCDSSLCFPSETAHSVSHLSRLKEDTRRIFDVAIQDQNQRGYASGV